MVPFCKRKSCFLQKTIVFLNIYYYACEKCSTHEICLYDSLLSIKVLLLLLVSSTVLKVPIDVQVYLLLGGSYTMLSPSVAASQWMVLLN